MEMSDPAPMLPEKPDLADEGMGENLKRLHQMLGPFVMSILPHRAGCEEVVQETLLFLWEKWDEVGPETNLKAWAFKVARFKTMAWRRDQSRDHLVFFADDTLVEIAGEAEALAGEINVRREALDDCLDAMDNDSFLLLERFYMENTTIADIARETGKKCNLLYKKIAYLRNALRKCVESKIRSI